MNIINNKQENETNNLIVSQNFDYMEYGKYWDKYINEYQAKQYKRLEILKVIP